MDRHRLSLRPPHHTRPAHLDGGWRLRSRHRIGSERQNPGFLRRAWASPWSICVGALHGSRTRSEDLRRRRAELALSSICPHRSHWKDDLVYSLRKNVLGVRSERGLDLPAKRDSLQVVWFDLSPAGRVSFNFQLIANVTAQHGRPVASICTRFCTRLKSSKSARSAREDLLVPNPESEARFRADFLHVDFLQPEAVQAGAFERPQTAA